MNTKPKATRNKTIELSLKEEKLYVSRCIKLKQKSSFNEVINKTIHQDALKAIDLLPDKCVDLMVVDPPYNLTKNFGTTTFKETDLKSYKKWLDKWHKKTVRILKDNSSVYICSPKPHFLGARKRSRRSKQLEELS